MENDDKIRVAVMSDMHFEFDRKSDGPCPTWTAKDVDLVLFAGDIHTKRHTPEMLERFANTYGVSVCWVAGNHEFYGEDLYGELHRFHEHSANSKSVDFLDNSSIERVIRGMPVRVLGCTLWSDFELYDNAEGAKRVAEHGMNDYRAIRNSMGGYRRLKPDDTQRLHFESRDWLEDQLMTPFDGKTVVMTHFAPLETSVPLRFDGDMLTPAFTSDLSQLIGEANIDLWAHGHTHDSFNYVYAGTRVVCNPRGYHGVEINPKFDQNLIVEI